MIPRLKMLYNVTSCTSFTSVFFTFKLSKISLNAVNIDKEIRPLLGRYLKTYKFLRALCADVIHRLSPKLEMECGNRARKNFRQEEYGFH